MPPASISNRPRNTSSAIRELFPAPTVMINELRDTYAFESKSYTYHSTPVSHICEQVNSFTCSERKYHSHLCKKARVNRNIACIVVSAECSIIPETETKNDSISCVRRKASTARSATKKYPELWSMYVES
jgi:hypothetical protein